MSGKLPYDNPGNLNDHLDIYDDLSSEIPGAIETYAKELHELINYPPSRRDAIKDLFGLLLLAGIVKTHDIVDTELGKKSIKKLAMRSEIIFRKSLIDFGLEKEVIENIINSIVIIFSRKGFIRKGSGTGFFVGDNIILTAGHVIGEKANNISYNFVNPEEPLAIYNLKGEKYDTERVYGDSGNDLGAIVVSEKGNGFIKTQKIPSSSGETVTVGFGGRNPHITTGEEIYGHGNTDYRELDMNKNNIKDGDEVMFLSNDVIGGDSGCPVIDKSGNLKGLAIFKRASGTAGAEPIKDIEVFVQKMKKDLGL